MINELHIGSKERKEKRRERLEKGNKNKKKVWYS
jgi:hypothetical protein